MSIDPRKLMSDLKKRKPEKATVSLFVERKAYKDFQALCAKHKVGASELIEEFMRQAVDPAMATEDMPLLSSSPSLRRILDRLAAQDETELSALADRLEAEYPSVGAAEGGRKSRQQRK